jgi:hypothetical protein
MTGPCAALRCPIEKMEQRDQSDRIEDRKALRRPHNEALGRGLLWPITSQAPEAYGAIAAAGSRQQRSEHWIAYVPYSMLRSHGFTQHALILLFFSEPAKENPLKPTRNAADQRL